jgi:hypothetical protein
MQEINDSGDQALWISRDWRLRARLRLRLLVSGGPSQRQQVLAQVIKD